MNACLDPAGLLRETGVLAVGQVESVLTCFQLRLHLDDGLMEPDERLFSFPCLSRVSLSLSRVELRTCRLVLSTELGLPALQNLADALRADRGNWCRETA